MQKTIIQELSVEETGLIAGGITATEHWWDMNRDMCIANGMISMQELMTAA